MEDQRDRIEETISLFLQYKFPVAFGFISLVFILLSIFLLYKTGQNQTSIEFFQDESSSSAELSKKTIVVDMSGGVQTPGVYELPEGSRIADGIYAAGGLSRDADQLALEKGINQAQRLLDGAKVYIPVKGKTQPSVNTIDAKAASGEVQSGGVISINSAAQASLESLPGIGPVTATKIIQGRPYMSLEELVSKKVVGQKTYEKLDGQISL